MRYAHYMKWMLITWTLACAIVTVPVSVPAPGLTSPEHGAAFSLVPPAHAREDENIRSGLDELRRWLTERIGPVVGMIALVIAGIAMFAMGARGLSFLIWVLIGILILTGAESIVNLLQEWFRR